MPDDDRSPSVDPSGTLRASSPSVPQQKGTHTASPARTRPDRVRGFSLSALDALQNTSGTVEDPTFRGAYW